MVHRDTSRHQLKFNQSFADVSWDDIIRSFSSYSKQWHARILNDENNKSHAKSWNQLIPIPN